MFFSHIRDMKEFSHYLGVSGVNSLVELEMIEDSAIEFKIAPERIMIGILVSYKCLANIDHDRQRYPRIYRLHDLAKVAHSKGFLTIIHYNTHNSDKFHEEIITLCDRHDLWPHIDGFQLNITNPSPQAIDLLHSASPSKALIVQINKAFLQKGNEYIENFIVNIKEKIQYALIDPSGGTGTDFDVSNVHALYHALCPHTKVVIAGGLSDKNIIVRMLEIITLTQGSNFSIDAESDLRDHRDMLVFDKVRRYIGGWRATIGMWPVKQY